MSDKVSVTPLAHRAKWARKVTEHDKPLRVDSIGTCQLCGYHGPGPQHDCKPKANR